MTEIAKGSFEVSLQPLPFDNPGNAQLARTSINKRISGDLVATTEGQMLSAMTDVKGSAGYVALETVSGTLAGRRGSFVLQHHGVMQRGVPSLSVIIVPDSGTEELAGIEGVFKIDIVDGTHFYELAYRLPGA